MINLEQMQLEHKEWSQRNFPNSQSWEALLGVLEEAGELSHAFLKRHQGIRYDHDTATKMIEDGVADIVIFLLDFCNKQGMRIEDVLTLKRDKVRQRDWLKDPKNGGQPVAG